MTVSYSAIKAVSQPNAMEDLLANQVIGPVLPSVEVRKVRAKEGRRFEAPRILWNVYEATLGMPGGDETSFLFWTKAYFDDADCQHYRKRNEVLLRKLGGNPLDPRGYARFFEELNLFMFFFPVDPAFPSLPAVFDAEGMAPLLAPHLALLRPGGTVRSVEAVR